MKQQLLFGLIFLLLISGVSALVVTEPVTVTNVIRYVNVNWTKHTATDIYHGGAFGTSGSSVETNTVKLKAKQNMTFIGIRFRTNSNDGVVTAGLNISKNGVNIEYKATASYAASSFNDINLTTSINLTTGDNITITANSSGSDQLFVGFDNFEINPYVDDVDASSNAERLGTVYFNATAITNKYELYLTNSTTQTLINTINLNINNAQNNTYAYNLSLYPLDLPVALYNFTVNASSNANNNIATNDSGFFNETRNVILTLNITSSVGGAIQNANLTMCYIASNICISGLYNSSYSIDWVQGLSNITIRKAGFQNYNTTFNVTHGVLGAYTATFMLSSTVGITFRDEQTLALFNMSSPNSMAIEIFYTDGDSSSIALNGSSSNPYSLNLTKSTASIRIIEYYTTPNVVTVYRTYPIIDVIDINSLNITAWLVDIRQSDVILNTLQIFDLMSDYQNPRVIVTKVINGTESFITGDYADVEGKISAYLLRGAQYTLTVYSTNKPTRVIGRYYADEAGIKYIRLFDIVGVDLTSASNAMVVDYSTYLINVTGVLMIYSQYNGTYVTNVTWEVYNNTILGGLLSTSSLTDPAAIFTYAVPDEHAGTTAYFIRMVIGVNCSASTQACITPIVYDKTVDVNNAVPMPAQFNKPYTLQWILFIVILIVALSLNAKTMGIGGLLLVGLAGFMAYIGWLKLGATENGIYLVLGLAVVAALILIFRKGSQP